MSASEEVELRKRITQLKREVSALEKEKASLEVEVKEFRSELGDHKLSLQTVLNERINLEKQIEDMKKERPSISVEDFASSLGKTLSSVQTEVGRLKKTDETGYVVDKFEVELKTGLDLSKIEGIKLVQPSIAELKPEGLSTIRLSFKAKPKFKVVQESDDNQNQAVS